ncbi:MAG: helix-turn-helix transcriptional regulator [Eubacteriales bacterium]|nr:helix-turn-helix transcriptional regulator [Eubacteriales bacterium]
MLGQNIATFRKKKNITQEKLAEYCGVSRQAVTKWESGNSEPDVKKLIMLAELFEITLDELVFGKKKNNEKDSDQTRWRHFYFRFIKIQFDEIRDYYIKQGLESIYFVLIEYNFLNYVASIFYDGDEIKEKYNVSLTTKEQRNSHVSKLKQMSGEELNELSKEYIDGNIDVGKLIEGIVEAIDLKYKDVLRKEVMQLNSLLEK